MADVKFSFEGDPGTLAALLGVLVRGGGMQALSGNSVIPGLPLVYPPASADGPTMEPLHVDPVYDGGDASNPAPSAYPPQEPEVRKTGFDFGGLPLKEEAWSCFAEFVRAWSVGFDCDVDEETGEPAEEQPDRLQLLKNLGSGQWSVFVLRWCAHYHSLQGAIAQVLGAEDLEVVDRVSANIAQVAHASFPDIGGFHDYSTTWRRELTIPEEDEQEKS